MSDVVMPASIPESETVPENATDTGVAERMTSYRRDREQVERGILPLATSVDGYSFEFRPRCTA